MTSPPAPAPPSPLVAPRIDTTRATSGIALVETAEALERSVSSDSWMDEALAGVGFGIEFAAAVIDPLGALAAAGLGWLMEHVQPLSDVLDRLAGDPDAVTAQARTWRNVAVAVRAAGEDLARATEPGTDWTGEAADAFRVASATSATEIGVSAVVADTLGAAVERAGDVVALVRDVVRELIAQLIATLLVRIPQWTLEEVGTLGIATPHVVASALAVVAKVAKQVIGLVRALVGSLRHLGDLVDQVLDLARHLFPATARPAPTPTHTPTPTVPTRVAPTPTPLPHTPFGPGAARAEGLSPRALLDDTATTPAARPAPTTPARTPAPPGPRPGSGPPSPEEMAQVSRIRAALEPDLPPLASQLPPVGPGTRTLVDALPPARVTRGPDGLITRIDGRPYQEVVRETARQRAEGFRAARHPRTMSSRTIGKVTSVAMDRVTGRIVESTNGRGEDVLAREDLNPTIEDRVKALRGPGGRFEDTNGDGTVNTDADGAVLRRDHPHPDDPLRHAEVKAVNELLNERGSTPTPADRPTDLAGVVVDNYYPFRGEGVSPAPCCANCSAVLDGVEALPGRFDTFPPTGEPRGSRR